MKQKLVQKQKLIFTQSLRQSMKVLELPLLELKGLVEAEIVENPTVEEIPQESPPLSELPQTHTAESYPYDVPLPFFGKETIPSELANYRRPIPGKKESLSDTLMRQLRINASHEEEIRIGTTIINHLDQNGYLLDDSSLLCAKAACREEELAKALTCIQAFDPPGVGARDLKECLLIQLRRMKGTDIALCIKIVEKYLEDLAKGETQKMAKRLKCPPEALAKAIAKIQRLEPKPGRSFIQDEIAYIIPDIIIEVKDDTLLINALDDFIPKIRVSLSYKSMLKSKKVDDKTKDFIRQKMQNANHLLRAVRQRRETLSKTVRVIAEHQKEAILDGMEKLKPLTLREVAKQILMDESTVSRVVMHKYVQVPSGIFALRSFFSGALKSASGEDVSSRRIKLKIKELIEEEDKTRPLSDQQIVDLILKEEDTSIARRTVAKYRGILKLPPASQRRRPAGI